MTLAAGIRVGPYDILDALGAGGMGVVFRARDSRLGRDVAIKALPEAVQAQPDRLRRFEQEARAAGALNHPNLLVVFDLGTHEGTPYLVTELLEGMTLRERLQQGAIPLARATDLATQMARGLAAAHERGIVHRDLKPENLFITRDGRLKLLDFGLAKALDTAPPGDDGTLTDSGAVMGTAGYMSPEQVRAQRADRRADVFGFGAVLYEMLTGKPAFEGASSVERGYAVLTADPPDLTTASAVPPEVARIVRRCLEKSPDDRFQSASDLLFALEGLVPSATTGGRATTLAPERRAPWLLAAGLVVFAAGAGVLAGRASAPPSIEPPPAASPTSAPASIPTFTRLTFRRGAIGNARFAPDGTTVVYDAAIEGERPQIYATTPGNPDARPVSAPNTRLFSISRHGDMALGTPPAEGKQPWARTLAKASLAGGAPRDLLDDVLDADWAPDGSLLVVREKDERTTIEYPAGTPLVETDSWVSHARVSPDGERVAFLEHPVAGDDRGSVEIVARGGARRSLAGTYSSVWGLAWAPGGDEVWYSAIKGSPSRSIYAVSLGGSERLVYQAPGNLRLEDLAPGGRALVTRDDARDRIVALLPGATREIDLSWFDGSNPIDLARDGRHLLFIEGREAAPHAYGAFLRRTDGAPAVKLAEGMARALSPDGKYALVSPVAPFHTLTLVPTGAGPHRTLPPGSLSAIESCAFFPDGERVLITGREAGRGSRLWVQDLDGGPPVALSAEGVASSARLSPDGRKIAAVGADDGALILPVDGGPALRLDKIASGDLPLQWSDDGLALYVMRGVPQRSTRRGPAEVYLHDLATGRSEPWRTFTPEDTAGLMAIKRLFVTPDGEGYVYSFLRVLSDTYLVEGLR